MKNTLESLKTGDKKELMKRKNEIKANLDSLKLKINRTTKIINKLKEIVRDPWIPIPEVNIKETEERIEKVNKNIPPNTISIEIKDLIYRKTNVYFNLNFPYINEKSINEFINQKGDNKFNYSINLKVDKFDLKALTKKSLELIMYQKGFCFGFCKDYQIGELRIRLDDLKIKSEISGDFEIILDENKNSKNLEDSLINPRVYISIKLRNPVTEKEYEDSQKSEVEITKIYPSFRSDFRNVKIEIPKEEKLKPKPIDNKINDNSISKSENEEIVLKPKPFTNLNPEVKITNEDIKIDPSEFAKEELENPDILDNLNSIKVLEMKTKFYEDQISKIEGRAPKDLREKYLKCKVKCKTLENEIQSGNINIDQYIMLMKTQLDHDKKLLSYFKIHNREDEVLLISERIPLLIIEMKEAIDCAKTFK